MTHVSQEVWVVDYSLEKYARGHEHDFSPRALSVVHTNMVAHSIADLLSKLKGHSLCNVNDCNPSGLSANYERRLEFISSFRVFEDVLRHLGGFTTARVS